ncbi:hypothetical protein WR25_01165 [Diploscapter pachys]|uniref:Uncharacterized protein n=1 Tax=Diploscapter pachys TaxID=2018661 RepID=A0A2A2JY33_9BILA|nr:hypothetical protein WR25_01165 [Diploscapter pachys]
MVLVDPVGQVDAIHPAREQVDRRGAERHELGGAHAAFQRGVDTVEQHQQLQLLAVAALDRALQPGEVDEQIALGQGEILLQQAIALEGLRHHRQRCFAVIEATGQQGVLDRDAFDPVGARLAHEHRAGAAQQLFVQAERGFVGTVEVQRQVRQRQAGERNLGAAAQGQAQSGAGFRFAGGQAPEHSPGVAEVLGPGNLQRPQGDVLGAAKFAGRLRIAPKIGAQDAVTG